MSQITTPITLPLSLNNEGLEASSVITSALVANTVYLYAFVVSVPIALSGAKWETGLAVLGSGGTDVGIYSFAGTLLVHFAAVVQNVASSIMSGNFATNPYTLAPGQYFMAYCVSDATDLIRLAVPTAGTVAESGARKATNNGTAGVLPPTTGGYGAPPGKFPAFSLTVVGGLV
jgi:hypothetical protein